MITAQSRPGQNTNILILSSVQLFIGLPTCFIVLIQSLNSRDTFKFTFLTSVKLVLLWDSIPNRILGSEVDPIDDILFCVIQNPFKEHACKPPPLVFGETVVTRLGKPISTMAALVYVSTSHVELIDS